MVWRFILEKRIHGNCPSACSYPTVSEKQGWFFLTIKGLSFHCLAFIYHGVTAWACGITVPQNAGGTFQLTATFVAHSLNIILISRDRSKPWIRFRLPSKACHHQFLQPWIFLLSTFLINFRLIWKVLHSKFQSWTLKHICLAEQGLGVS